MLPAKREQPLGLTGELRSQVDAIWNAFWSGGISNPMEVLEQITYLLFIRRLDDAHTLEGNKALMLGKPIETPVLPSGTDGRGRSYADLRWSRFTIPTPGLLAKGVDLLANQLHALGFRGMSAQSLKPKHVEALIKRWRESNLAVAMMRNRMTALRWWAEKVNRQNMIARANDRYGIPDRQFVSKEACWTPF